MNQQRIVLMAFAGAVALWASSALAQRACRDAQTVGCVMDPNTGKFIERGSAPQPSTPSSDRQREPMRTAPQPHETEQQRRAMERARALDRQRDAETLNEEAYRQRCVNELRLDQPECRHVKAQIAYETEFNNLRARMGQQSWEQWRFVNKVPAGFEADVQRLQALERSASAARAEWERSSQVQPAQSSPEPEPLDPDVVAADNVAKGLKYLKGEGVPKDLGKAFLSFRSACDLHLSGTTRGCGHAAELMYDYPKEVTKVYPGFVKGEASVYAANGCPSGDELACFVACRARLANDDFIEKATASRITGDCMRNFDVPKFKQYVRERRALLRADRASVR